nr:MAG TPA: hypothetical protein [Caudoviricetes sp.]
MWNRWYLLFKISSSRKYYYIIFSLDIQRFQT